MNALHALVGQWNGAQKWQVFGELVSKYFPIAVFACACCLLSFSGCLFVRVWTTQSLWGHNNNRSTSFQWYCGARTRARHYQFTSQQPDCLVVLSKLCISYSHSQCFFNLHLQIPKYTVTDLYLVRGSLGILKSTNIAQCANCLSVRCVSLMLQLASFLKKSLFCKSSLTVYECFSTFLFLPLDFRVNKFLWLDSTFIFVILHSVILSPPGERKYAVVINMIMWAAV